MRFHMGQAERMNSSLGLVIVDTDAPLGPCPGTGPEVAFVPQRLHPDPALLQNRRCDSIFASDAEGIKMRTTLDIDDEVLRAAKEIARRRHSTAGAVISELARQALTGATAESRAVAEEEGFYGFRPLPAGGRLVSAETVDRLREDEGI
jgi:hypothetical protein